MIDEMVSVTAVFRTRGGAEVSCPCQFNGDEWELLGRFLEYAKELAKTRLLSTPGRLEFSLTADDAGVRFEASALPQDDDVAALLLFLRPFVLKKKESTYFHKVANILARRMNAPALQAYIDRQKQIFDGVRWQKFNLVSNGVHVNSAETLETWLNGFKYHRDPDKRATFDALHDGDLPKEFTTAMFIGMLNDRARAVIELAQAIDALRNRREIERLPGDVE